MKTLLVPALLVAVSTTAFAQPHNSPKTNLDIINQDMSHLEQVDSNVDMYIVTQETPNFQYVSYIGTLEQDFKERYITSKQAKEMELEKVKKFHVYSAINANQLTKNITQHIQRDAPKYFSVDFYQNVVGNSDMVEYVARVIEYK
ncbi:hypothetical protein [Vibrio methylphosphonaticus]|uniref:hypothetical protein n=1 Tax=Vibrio methylphosphonaticus TaxID=2946866 RepID=UPI00202A63A5|nr:hypothetical protein [Vibrio methylphosphonaticus]MCL9773923.1 hypothetical protein [Vibrio methylphosphonaticus]